MLRIAVVVVLAGCTQAASSPIDADRCPTAEPANQSTCAVEALGCTYGRTYCQCDEFQGANGMTWGCAVSSCPTDVGCAD
jgi:hypothetical protein